MQQWLRSAMSRVPARGRGTRRKASVVAAALAVMVVVLSSIAGSSGAGASGSPPTRQEIAQKILDSPAGKTLTAPARLALEMVARGDNRLAPDSKGLTPTNAKLSKGGHTPGGQGKANVLVNNPGEDGYQHDQTTQSETTIAVAGSNVAVGFNDSQTALQFLTAGTDLTGYAYSRNGGKTFTDGGQLPNGPGLNNLGDPWLASDSAGTMYFSNLTEDSASGSLDVGLSRSTDGGKTWSPTALIPPPAGISPFGYSADKDALTAGPGAGNLYDVWDDFTVTVDPNTFNVRILSGLAVAHSTNGGASWTTVYADQVAIFDSSNACPFSQYIGSQPIVGPDGTVYDAALQLNGNNCTPTPETESEWIFASHDGGATFPQKVKIADVTSSTPNGSGVFVLGPSQYMRNLEFPTLAFLGNTLYATWNDGGDGSGHSHIRLAKSSDDGATWTTAFVTSGTNDEAQPSMSGDAAGLHILYYEISPDAANPGSSLLDVFVASAPDGAAFSTSRVTTESFPGVFTVPQFDPVIALTYMGDYISNVSSGGHQYFAWGDNRDIVTNFLWPNGRHDPDVYFAAR